jgi:hypothetical protein
MAFEVRDLMVDVFPEDQAGIDYLACPANSPNAPAPPQPCPAPSCANNSARAEGFEERAVRLPALTELREQLRLSLHA